jgi:ribonuclease HII
LEEEALLWKQGGAFVFGVDEAGRGCLAGPVCAAVACWAPHSAAFAPCVDLRDSKQMTEAQREAAFVPVSRLTLASGVGFASPEEIDRWNILRATYLAVARALESAMERMRVLGLQRQALSFLTDGNHPLVTKSGFFVHAPDYQAEFPLLRSVFATGFAEKCLVKGDSRAFSIASASVLAKVSRDRHMAGLDQAFPAYEFSIHKGYSTPRHMEILRRQGPCSEHRRSFAPVSESVGLFSRE